MFKHILIPTDGSPIALRAAKAAIRFAAEAGGDVARYRVAVRKGHMERLASDSGLPLPPNTLPAITRGAPPVPTNFPVRSPHGRRLGNQGQVHMLLAYYPLPKVQQLYTTVFEDILREKVSTLPVITK